MSKVDSPDKLCHVDETGIWLNLRYFLHTCKMNVKIDNVHMEKIVQEQVMDLCHKGLLLVVLIT